MTMKMDDMSEFKTYRLARFDLSASRILTDYQMALGNLELSTQKLIEGMLIQMRTWFLANEHKVDPVDVYTWETWWDHFKADHFPMWAQNRWPPKKKKQVIIRPQHVWVCPHSDLKWPDVKHLEFLAQVDYGCRYYEAP